MRNIVYLARPLSRQKQSGMNVVVGSETYKKAVELGFRLAGIGTLLVVSLCAAACCGVVNERLCAAPILCSLAVEIAGGFLMFWPEVFGLKRKKTVRRRFIVVSRSEPLARRKWYDSIRFD